MNEIGEYNKSGKGGVKAVILRSKKYKSFTLWCAIE